MLGYTESRGDTACVEQDVYRKSLYLPLSFAVNLKLLLKVSLNEKEMNYWYIQQMDEFQNGYAEWKKLDPPPKKVYSVWFHLKSRNAKCKAVCTDRK